MLGSQNALFKPNIFMNEGVPSDPIKILRKKSRTVPKKALMRKTLKKLKIAEKVSIHFGVTLVFPLNLQVKKTSFNVGLEPTKSCFYGLITRPGNTR